jgi:hypothetical protein
LKPGDVAGHGHRSGWIYRLMPFAWIALLV